jgi:hypothetical protein
MATTGDTRRGPTAAAADDQARTPDGLDAEGRRMLGAVLAGEGVREVCGEHDLSAALASAVNLIRSVCGPAQSLTADVDLDPDTDERRVILDVTLDAPYDDVLERYYAFTRKWVDAVPAEVREWVRFAFHTLRD